MDLGPRSEAEKVYEVYESAELGVRAANAVIRDRLEHFEWIARPETVLAVPYIPDGRLVLIKQYRSAIDGFTLKCPAGKIGDGVAGEGRLETLERELKEEVGYRVETADRVGHLLTEPHLSDETIHIYMTRGTIVAEPKPTSYEQLEVVPS